MVWNEKAIQWEMAWEITEDDIQAILDKHGVNADTNEILVNLIDGDQVMFAALAYCEFDDQVNAARSEIEDQLIKEGIVVGEKKFFI